MIRCVAIATAVVVLVAPGPAEGFHGAQSFELSANEGGGGGMFFTGAPRWKRYECSICHVDAPGAVALTVASEPPALLEQGLFEPGARYQLTVTLVGETRGLSAASNINTFVAEFVDELGEPVGQFDIDSDDVLGLAGDRVVAARGQEGRDQWRVTYLAPPAGTGAIALYVAAVDGDGAGNGTERLVDAEGDDVAVLTRRVCEAGVACDATPAEAGGTVLGGCHVAGGRRTRWLWLVAVLGLLTRRRARLTRGSDRGAR